MINPGEYNSLKVVRKASEGLYLDGEDFGEILLPKKEIPVDYHSEEALDVFVYFNSDEELVPTTRKPLGVVGTFACLKVVSVSDMGAFLDWGMPKDLFVPRAQQEEAMEEGETYIVYIFKESKRNRLAASAKIDLYLNKKPVDFSENDKVDLLITHQTDLGINAIVNNSHWGLFYQDELFDTLRFGQRTRGYVKKVRADGKIDLSLHKSGYQKMDDLEEKILAHLNSNSGQMMITDKSSPEIIYETFSVSKKKYKMALGSLYKAKRIVITDDVIRLV